MKTAGKTLDDEEVQAILKDTAGIGTEATRATILDELKKRGYLFIQKITFMSVNKERHFAKQLN